MDEKISKELETLEMEHYIRIIRQDLHVDALQSARLVRAAQEKNWKEVEKLLEEGADPRICREATPDGNMVSALHYALAAKQYELAGKLYKAGDRLDDVRLDEYYEPVPAETLAFLAFEMHCGRNYFYDESKPLSECCRCAAFEQIDKLIETASQDELNKSIEPIFENYIHYKAPIYIQIMEELIARGAKLSDQEKEELLATVELCRRWPEVMRPPKEEFEKMISLIKQA